MYHRAKRAGGRTNPALIITICLLTVCIILAGTFLIADQDRTAAAAIADAQRPRVTVHFHGQTYSTDASGETARQLLHRMGLDPEPGDILSLPENTPMQNGMVLSVDQIRQQEETYTSVLKAKTVYRNDVAGVWGEEKVLIPGSDGEALCTAEVEYTNGQETARRVMRRKILHPSVDRVVAVGTDQNREPEDAKPEINYGYILLPDGQMLTYTHSATIQATAYTHTDAGYTGITAAGTTAHVGTAAVDPNYIPYGTRMFIIASDGSYVYGIAQAEDCGGHMQGDRVDLYLPTAEACAEFGRRTCTVFFLG